MYGLYLRFADLLRLIWSQGIKIRCLLIADVNTLARRAPQGGKN